MTYGPGELYWQRFGHNGIWIRDAGLGLDHVFNFGFFDFGQEDFFLRFLQGRMLYFSAARPSREEFASYIDENRSIRAQRLDLALEARYLLIEFLLNEIRPENRDYLYDYYENNCSTRVRDALDLALAGALREGTEGEAAEQTRRDHTRRLTADDFWLYLGLETALGAPVDGPINRWQELFIPGELAGALATAHTNLGGLRQPLVVEDVMLFESSLPEPPAAPVARWLRYLLASLALVAFGWALARKAPGAVRLLSRAWLLATGLAGCALLFFWFGTNHAVASLNLNLLLFSPLWLPLAAWRGGERICFGAVLALTSLAVLMGVAMNESLLGLPPGQYMLDTLAAFAPLNLAAATALVRFRPRPATPPGAPAARDR